MKTCYIFGAADGVPTRIKKEKDDLVIAADGGLSHLKRLNIEPDITLGDFDSLGYVPSHGEIIRHPVHKDDTDMMLAVRVGLARGFTRFVLYGGTGGRPDHTMANYQTLGFIVTHGGIGFLCFRDFTATVISAGSLCFSDRARGTVSVFAMSGELGGVTLKGLLYPLADATLTYDFPLGVSNEFTGVPAEIQIKSGTALVLWSGTPEDVIAF